MTRILSLDDEPEMVKLLHLILERAGYECVGTTDDQEAFKILRTGSIDLFTQDFMRPQTDGLQFLQQMKSDPSLRTIPVLGVSAGRREARAEQLKRFGLDIDRDLDGYLKKPFGPMHLLEMIEAILRRHEKHIPKQAVEIRKRGKFPPIET
jgi:CheY-like chemotaxis protein